MASVDDPAARVSEKSGPGNSLDQHLHERMARLGELTAGIAHELNNTVGSISSNLDSLRRYGSSLVHLVERIEHHLSPDQRQRWHEELRAARWDAVRSDLGTLIDETSQGADHLRRMVGDLRALARSDGSHDQLSLDACVTSALAIIAHQTRQRATVDQHLAAPRAIALVRAQIIHLVLNLVLNAVQALGSVRGAKPGIIRIRTSDRDGAVHLVIEDSGPGIAPAIAHRLFQPHATTKPTGTGLGLAYARQIAAAHGGTIGADRSADLGGARFTVVLVGASSSRSETQAG
jgi:two-component system, NtrC family, sensor kinase